jgi:hypothetical protein
MSLNDHEQSRVITNDHEQSRTITNDHEHECSGMFMNVQKF